MKSSLLRIKKHRPKKRINRTCKLTAVRFSKLNPIKKKIIKFGVTLTKKKKKKIKSNLI